MDDHVDLSKIIGRIFEVYVMNNLFKYGYFILEEIDGEYCVTLGDNIKRKRAILTHKSNIAMHIKEEDLCICVSKGTNRGLINYILDTYPAGEYNHIDIKDAILIDTSGNDV